VTSFSSTVMVSNDYLIDHSNFDWRSLLREWMWLIPADFNVLKMSKFGDLFMALGDERVYLLDVSAGTLTKVGESPQEFEQKVEEGDNAIAWFLVPLIDRLKERGLMLLDGQCYGLRQPTALGGKYSFQNICVVTITDYLGAYGSIHAQLKDVPYGTEIIIKVKK
jgi:hypothetical protein